MSDSCFLLLFLFPEFPRRCGRLRIPESFFFLSPLKRAPILLSAAGSISFYLLLSHRQANVRSQPLASVLRLNLSVAGAFAESEDASPSGPQNSTDANLPKDESHCVDHAITPCRAHAKPAEDTHASSAMNLKPQCTSAVEPTACKRLWRFTAHQCAGWWQHLSC